jgi:hypothetical protein
MPSARKVVLAYSGADRLCASAKSAAAATEIVAAETANREENRIFSMVESR